MIHRPNRLSPSLPLAAVLSLVLHGVFFLWNRTQLPSTAVISPVPIDLIPQTEFRARSQRPSGQIVKSEDAENSQADPEAKYLGARNQSAPNQSVARAGDGKQRAQAVKPSEDQKNSADVVLPVRPKTLEQLSLKDLGLGGEIVSDAVKGLDKGERTILSTREYKYFSFYERVRELSIEQHWRPLVERAVYRLWQRNRVPRADEVSTHLVLVLDKSGSIQKLSIVKSSGVKELDDAAVTAMQRGAPFPNPPSGMLDDDGFLRISWVMNVELVSSRSLIQVDFGGPAERGSP